MKTPKQKLVKENDTIWSLLVRIRDNFSCRMCGKSTKHAEASHIIGRDNWNTRWDTQNGISLCFYCHRFRIHGGKMTEQERIEFYEKTLGKELYKALLTKAKQAYKRNLSTALLWNTILRSEFLKLTGMTYEEYKKEAKENRL